MTEYEQLVSLLEVVASRLGAVEGQVEAMRKRLENGPGQEWLSIKEAAVVVGLSEDHVRRAVTGSALPCSNVGTNDRPLYRISRKDLEAFMERRKAGALPPQKGRGKRKLQPSPFFSAKQLESYRRS